MNAKYVDIEILQTFNDGSISDPKIYVKGNKETVDRNQIPDWKWEAWIKNRFIKII
jgi:hypothetical protein